MINTFLKKLKITSLSLDEAICFQQLIGKFAANTVGLLDVEPNAWDTLVALLTTTKPLLRDGQELISPLRVVLDQVITPMNLSRIIRTKMKIMFFLNNNYCL